jgi:hypothetical protein
MNGSNDFEEMRKVMKEMMLRRGELNDKKIEKIQKVQKIEKDQKENKEKEEEERIESVVGPTEYDSSLPRMRSGSDSRATQFLMKLTEIYQSINQSIN